MGRNGREWVPGAKSALVNNVGLLCLIIDGSDGRAVRSRVRLQKVAYFCQYLGWSLRDYRLYRYQLFSQTLADTVADAESGGVITGDDGEPHALHLTDYGKKVTGLFIENVCDQDKVDRTRRLAQRLSGWSREELELASTIDYVANGSRMTKSALLYKVGAIKPAYAQGEIEQGYSKWRRLVRDESLPIKSVRW